MRIGKLVSYPLFPTALPPRKSARGDAQVPSFTQVNIARSTRVFRRFLPPMLDGVPRSFRPPPLIYRVPIRDESVIRDPSFLLSSLLSGCCYCITSSFLDCYLSLLLIPNPCLIPVTTLLARESSMNVADYCQHVRYGVENLCNQ